MKKAEKKPRKPSQEEMMEQVRKILEERGRKALEMARKKILQQKIECKEAREAIKYFITKYWHDLARPTLLSLVCEAVGGDPDTTIPIAIPMTLISGGIDIHDDIIDESKIKGFRSTVLGKFGKDTALIVGDALIFKGFTLLHEAHEKGIPAEKASVISDIIVKAFFELADAEASELQFRGRTDVSPEEYLRVVRKKAADVEAHTCISAILGGGSEEEIEVLRKYGRLLGMMLILRDDVRDVTEFQEVVHRIEKECLPLPILYALQNPEGKSKLTPILLKKITEKDAKTLLQITEEAEGFKHTEELMEKLNEDISHLLKKLKKNKEILLLLSKSLLLPNQQVAD